MNSDYYNEHTRRERYGWDHSLFFPSQRKGNGIYVDTVHVKKPNVIKLDGDESMSSYSLCNTYYWFGVRWSVYWEPPKMSHNGGKWIFYMLNGENEEGWKSREQQLSFETTPFNKLGENAYKEYISHTKEIISSSDLFVRIRTEK